MPVRHARSETRGRPPFGRRGGVGKNGSTRSHNGSGSSAAAIPVHATSPTRIRFRRFCYALLGSGVSNLEVGHEALLSSVERLDRIYGGGPAGGNVAGRECDSHEQHRCATECDRIEGGHSEQQALDKSRSERRERKASSGDADCCEGQPLPEHEASDARAICAERNADTDFPRAAAPRRRSRRRCRSRRAAAQPPRGLPRRRRRSAAG